MCRAGTRSCRARDSPRGSMFTSSESRNARSRASESNAATGTPRWFESRRLTSESVRPSGIVTRLSPLMPYASARSSAGTVIPSGNEYWPALMWRSSSITRASTRKLKLPRSRPTRFNSAETPRRLWPRITITTRRSCGGKKPAGTNRSEAIASPATIRSSSAQRRGRNGPERDAGIERPATISPFRRPGRARAAGRIRAAPPPRPGRRGCARARGARRPRAAGARRARR